MLLDFYGAMLTDKQRDVIDLYYNQDLSLAEIAEHEKITRQGVRDNIKRGEAYMLELEKNLRMVQQSQKLVRLLEEIDTRSREISRANKDSVYSAVIQENAAAISKQIAAFLEEFD